MQQPASDASARLATSVGHHLLYASNRLNTSAYRHTHAVQLHDLLASIPCTFHAILCAAGSKRQNVAPFFALSCEVAIRPSFCWNSHQDTWPTTGVWSQFDSGLKCCQDDVYACTNFMGHQDAAFAGMCALH